MRKILMLAFVLAAFFSVFSASSPACMAADWYWVCSTEEHTTYVDKSTGYRDGAFIYCYDKTVSKDGSNMVARVRYYLNKDRCICEQVREEWLYSSTGKLIKHNDYGKDFKTYEYPPGSV